MGSQSRYTEYITMPSQPTISIMQLEMTKLYFIAVCAFSKVGRERYLKYRIIFRNWIQVLEVGVFDFDISRYL